MATSVLTPRPQFLTAAGVIAVNYTLSTFTAGTSTPAATYPTQADSIALTNPNNVVLTVNSLGYLTSGGNAVDVWMIAALDFVLKDASGVIVYTEEDVNPASAAPGTLADADYGDITVSASNTVWTIDAGTVTFAKMANIATDRLIGRDTAGTGAPEALAVTGGIEFTGSQSIQTSAFTGDATKTAGGTALTLATVNSNVGTYGSTTLIPSITVNGKGLITAISHATPSYVAAIEKNTASPITARTNLNFIEGSGTTLVVADNAGNDSVDVTITASGVAGLASITEYEIDFGTTPVENATFTVTDASIGAGSYIVVQQSGEAATSKDADENEMDTLEFKVITSAGSMDVFVTATDGSYLADKFKINYLIG